MFKNLPKVISSLTLLIFLSFLVTPSTHAFLWIFEKKTGGKYIATGSFGDELLEKMKKDATEKLEKNIKQGFKDYPDGHREKESNKTPLKIKKFGRHTYR